jgi:YfiH family protein
MAQTPCLKSKNNLPFSELFQDELAAGFSNRLSGNMSLNYADTRESLANRRSFLESLGIEYSSLVSAKQIHSANIKRAGLLDKGTSLADTDAIITNEKKLPIAILSADCLSIFLYDPVSRSIGLVHAGWRGTQENIASKTVAAMLAEFNAQPGDIRIFLGPAIRSCCYQVQEDFQDKFPQGLLRQGGNFFLDLAGINKQELIGCRIDPAKITDCSICTACQNGEYFSFRKEGSSCGRIMSVMMLK